MHGCSQDEESLEKLPSIVSSPSYLDTSKLLTLPIEYKSISMVGVENLPINALAQLDYVPIIKRSKRVKNLFCQIK